MGANLLEIYEDSIGKIAILTQSSSGAEPNGADNLSRQRCTSRTNVTSNATLRPDRIRIETIEGPIDTELLQHICELYGRHVDSRYADIEFTRKVFNANPAGRSCHTFAFDKEEAVGCYALIPVKVTARGQKLWAGKGEALYVKEEHRAITLFLIRSGVNFGMERGLQLQFGFTTERLMRMLQLLGFAALPGVLDHRFRLIHPSDDSQQPGNRIRLISTGVISAVQARIEGVISHLRPHDELSVQMNCKEHMDSIFKIMSNKGSHVNRGWSVSMDEDSLRWWSSIGYLDVLTLGNGADEFVAVTTGARGNISEIIHWNMRQGGLARALLILRFIVRRAIQNGAAAVSVGPYADVFGMLKKATVVLGFVPWRAQRTIYVKATDPFFLDERNLRLNSFFNI